MHRTTRRRLLGTTGTLAAAALAGCASNGDETTAGGGDGDDTEQTDTTVETTATTEATTTEAKETTTGDDSTQVVVGPGGDLAFSPDSVTVETGDTVEWVWSSGGHNVVVDDQPEDANWEGTEGDASTTFDAGHTHTQPFEVAGTYSYYCSPHRGAGMTGEVVVE